MVTQRNIQRAARFAYAAKSVGFVEADVAIGEVHDLLVKDAKAEGNSFVCFGSYSDPDCGTCDYRSDCKEAGDVEGAVVVCSER